MSSKALFAFFAIMHGVQAQTSPPDGVVEVVMTADGQASTSAQRSTQVMASSERSVSIVVFAVSATTASSEQLFKFCNENHNLSRR